MSSMAAACLGVIPPLTLHRLMDMAASSSICPMPGPGCGAEDCDERDSPYYSDSQTCAQAIKSCI